MRAEDGCSLVCDAQGDIFVGVRYDTSATLDGWSLRASSHGRPPPSQIRLSTLTPEGIPRMATGSRPEPAGLDFTLRFGSPALDAGGNITLAFDPRGRSTTARNRSPH